MKNSQIKKISAIIFCMIAFFNYLKADITDSEGMPIVYLRGTCNYWDTNENYKFSRDGNLYTLVINSRNEIPAGEFKIADASWSFDFGAPYEGFYVDNSITIQLAPMGPNIHTSGISNAVISFEMPKENFCEVTFTFNASEDQTSLFSGTLPVMYINVYKDKDHSSLENEIIDYNLSHKNYFTEAEYWIDTNGCKWIEQLGASNVGSSEEPLPLQIKARGNWTRIGFSKKPFKLKLDKKQNLLGLTPEKSKHYALMAHADDSNGFMRNFTSFSLGEKIGLPWTPAMQPVELVINGDYRGLYFLTESIRIGDGRVEIEELGDNESDPELVSGGYIVELDNYDEENQIRLYEESWVNGHNLDLLRVTWDTPEVYSELQKRFITDQFSAINHAVGTNNDEMWKYLDLDDAARYYLVQEIVSDTESYHGSTYLYRDRGENKKWHFSPLWDAGNAFRGATDKFFYNCDPFGNTWIPSMRENTMFNSKVKDTWLWFMSNYFEEIYEDLEVFAEHISEGAKADHKRWDGEDYPEGGQGVADNSDINRRLTEVKDHLIAKVNWLKTQFGDYSGKSYPEPEKDTTPAAMLPDYAKAGINEIFIEDEAGDIEFFNLQGLRISHPEKGGIYIMRQGNKSKKIIF